jgi:hypothetical protein
MITIKFELESEIDGRPFKPKKLSVPFLYPGVPAGFIMI